MTVYENLRMGAHARRDRGAIGPDLARIFDSFPRLKERSRQQAGSLSGGEQQMLAIARALMSRAPLLLMDEPSLGLSPLMVRAIADIILRINCDGTSVLLVEQNARMALGLAHYGYVLETGRIMLQGEGRQLQRDERVRKAYFGG
jgi:branched-chain amino acid transport system ATP-binding protein